MRVVTSRSVEEILNQCQGEVTVFKMERGTLDAGVVIGSTVYVETATEPSILLGLIKSHVDVVHEVVPVRQFPAGSLIFTDVVATELDGVDNHSYMVVVHAAVYYIRAEFVTAGIVRSDNDTVYAASTVDDVFGLVQKCSELNCTHAQEFPLEPCHVIK